MWQLFVERWNNLNREQKVSVVLLGICGFFAIGLSVYRVRANVIEPFLVQKSEILATKKIVGPTLEEQEAKKKRTDTDGDGLSDWDEENVYRTNPNLRDSCGDGQPDNIRVITGKNLNCEANRPKDANVGNGDASATSTTNATDVFGSKFYTGVSSDGSVASGGGALPQISGQSTAPSQGSGLPRDPALIREALRGKVDQTKLDALSDQDLLKLYDQAVSMQDSVTSTTP